MVAEDILRLEPSGRDAFSLVADLPHDSCPWRSFGITAGSARAADIKPMRTRSNIPNTHSCTPTMPLPPSYRSRVLGSYYGLLVGDALGAPYEFRMRDSYTPAREYVRCTTFSVPLPEGGWTDDGSMALCLLESLLENRGQWNAADCVERWVKWRGEGKLYKFVQRGSASSPNFQATCPSLIPASTSE